MTNRREFIQITSAAALAVSAPASLLAEEMRRLPTRPIPGTDESLPVIGLGNSNSFRQGDVQIASDLLDLLLDHGGGYVDLGGQSREFVGQLAVEKGASGDLFLGNYIDPKDDDAMRDEAVRVAKAQGKVALDLVQTRDLAAYREEHGSYRDLKEDGLARYIGIARSGRQTFDAVEKLIEDGLVDFIQVNYSFVEPEAGERLLPLAMDNGVAVNINRPFINGQYFSIVRGKELPEWAAEFDCDSWAQFSLKFILAHPAVNCVLTETANPKHAVDNLGAGFGRLPDQATQQQMLELIRSYT
jgi:aryl-alcohol dehydrogenase-like predicted oxidoreductase